MIVRVCNRDDGLGFSRRTVETLDVKRPEARAPVEAIVRVGRIIGTEQEAARAAERIGTDAPPNRAVGIALLAARGFPRSDDRADVGIIDGDRACGLEGVAAATRVVASWSPGHPISE